MSLRANDLYASGIGRQSPALAASLRITEQPGYAAPSASDVEHLELRQDLIDRESVLLLQQQREKLQEVQESVRAKDLELESAKLDALKGTARIDALEGALSRTSARKAQLEKELADKAYALDQERAASEAARREKADLGAALQSYRERCDEYERRIQGYESRIGDLLARGSQTERQLTDANMQIRSLEAVRQRLVEAERELVDLRTRCGAAERELADANRERSSLRGDLAFERQKRQEATEKLARSDAALSNNFTEMRRLENDLRLRDAELRVKSNELESSRRLQDALARESYESKKQRELTESQLRSQQAQLEAERRDRAERARSRLSVLERRGLAEENVSTSIDNLAGLTASQLNASRGAMGSSMGASVGAGLGASGAASSAPGSVRALASPLTVSRASERMSKDQIRDLIGTIDRSMVN